MKVLSLVATAIACAAMAACATGSYHYSQLDGHRYFRSAIDTYPVMIVRVDGKDTMDTGRTEVDPGTRKVTVQAPPTLTSRHGDQRTIELSVAPCTRYYLVAVKENRLSNDFSVKVDYQEPVGGCTPPAVAMK